MLTALVDFVGVLVFLKLLLDVYYFSEQDQSHSGKTNSAHCTFLLIPKLNALRFYSSDVLLRFGNGSQHYPSLLYVLHLVFVFTLRNKSFLLLAFFYVEEDVEELREHRVLSVTQVSWQRRYFRTPILWP